MNTQKPTLFQVRRRCKSGTGEQISQMNLSGKRTLQPHTLWKIPRQRDTDGVKLVE
jgi:hypothetical protein